MRNFFSFNRSRKPETPADMSPQEKQLLIKTRNTIFNNLNPGNDKAREKAITQAPVTDLQDVGIVNGEYSQVVNVFSKYIYAIERDKRTRLAIYREMAKYPEIAFAVDEYVDEAVNEGPDGKCMKLIIRNKALNENDNMRKTIIAEFDHLMNQIIRIDKYIHQYFREYMVDGEIYFEKIFDIEDESKGICKVKKLMTTKIYPVYKDIESDDVLFYAYQGEDAGVKNLPKEMIAYANSGKFDWSKDEDMKVVLSFLEESKTTYKRLKLLEDALVIYRIVRAPERRVFKIDVGSLPKGRADQFMQEMIRKYRQRKFFDPATGDISEGLDMMAMTEDFWFPVFQGGRSSDVTTLAGGCLALDTIIPLLDGRKLTLQQIIDEHAAGKQNWVFSCDPESGEIKPGKIDAAGITKRNAQMMKLILDNGKEIKCTPEHKFPVLGKGMLEAKDIKENDSIIPFRQENKVYRGDKEYNFVYDTHRKEWIPTHKMVSNSITGTPFYNEIKYKLDEEKKVIHHSDVNRFNNNPENLFHMGFRDHFAFHSEKLSQIGLNAIKNKNGNEKSLREYWATATPTEKERFGKRVSKGIKKYLNTLTVEEREKLVSMAISNLVGANEKLQYKMLNDDSFRKNVLLKRGISIKAVKSSLEKKIIYSNNSKRLWSDKGYIAKMESSAKKQSIKCSFETFKMIVDAVGNTCGKCRDVVEYLRSNNSFTSRLKQENNDSHSNFNNITTSNIIKIIKKNGFRNWKHFKKDCKNINHRVVSIEYLSDREDVGDLQIDNNHIIHNYHTYALESGVFCHNSGLGEIGDIDYFLNKLYRGLKIPKSRFGEDNKFSIGDTSDITREEVKFVKEVKRYTDRFAEVFKDIFITHLTLKGIAEEYGITEQDIKIQMFANNLFEKFMEAKVLELRFQNFSNFKDLIDTEKPVFARKWIVQKYLEVDEEEWKQNQELLAAEKDSLEEEGEDGGGGGGGGGGMDLGGGDMGGDMGGGDAGGDAGGDEGGDVGGDAGGEEPAL